MTPADHPGAPRAATSTTHRTLRLVGAVVLAAGLGATAPVVAHAGAPAMVETGVCPDAEGVTVVVDKTDLGGEVEIACATDASTGTAALQSAGFADTRDAANLICAIDALPDPCPAEFTGSYWAYWTAERGGEWEMAMVGPDEAVPVAGGVEGWRYNDGSAGPSVDVPDPAAEEDATESTEASGDVQDGTSVTSSEAEPTEPSGPSPAAIGAGVAIVAALAVAAVLARRRSQHGPAGQD